MNRSTRTKLSSAVPAPTFACALLSLALLCPESAAQGVAAVRRPAALPTESFSIGSLDDLFSASAIRATKQDPEGGNQNPLTAPQDPPVVQDPPVGEGETPPPPQDPAGGEGETTPPPQDPAGGEEDAEEGSLFGDRAGGALSYNYGELRVVFGDLTGVILEGSYGFHESWFGIAHFQFSRDKESGVDVDGLSFSAGGGYHHPIQENLDIVGSIELEWGRAEASAFGRTISDSEVGVRLRAGVRFLPIKEVEVRGGLGYRTFFDGHFQVDLAGQYNFTDEWGAVAQLEFGENTFFGIGGRYTF